MQWNESDPSDEDQNAHEDAHTYRKRSSRACDQCRKTKSKCERSGGEDRKCKSCTLAGIECTFIGPSYKRGPPKGYIHAIEQRWHQVESLLGAILQCRDPRVQSIVSDLRQDDLAREILSRVDTGPYGPSGRRSRPSDTKEDIFASILRSNESGHGDSSRSRRQSRISREIVSSTQDHGLSVVPTKEWQDNLSRRLSGAGPSSSRSAEGVSPTQRRRLNGESLDGSPNTWNNLYTMDPLPDADEFKTTTEAMCELSLDENQEVRYHGSASGLHLLRRTQRTDDRTEGGVWRLPMARVWPPSKFGIDTYPADTPDLRLPSQDVQDRLIDLYFTYIHPIFPVIHKTRFLSEYEARKRGERDQSRSPGRSPGSSGSIYSSPRPEPTQEVTNLLLFSIFAISARMVDEDQPTSLDSDHKMWDGGCEYLDSARAIMNKVFHISRPSTVQAALLLGYREFGIGSMEQGWIYIGMGIRMAFDLGLNCDSSGWQIHNHALFSSEETQVRRQIWWACVLTDRYGSMYMGRPVMIRDEDHDTPLPNVDPAQERQPWQPVVTKNDIPYPPVPTRAMGAFCASSRLAMILGAIIAEIYPVKPAIGHSRKDRLTALESRLDQWRITLPDELRYDGTNKRHTPPPQILFLHVRYWGAVLLLHRAFIPNWKGILERPHESTVGTRAFDLAHNAACHISNIVSICRETFTLRKTSPFLTSYLFSAGIVHILTLTVQPDNVEAAQSLRQCMSALKEMQIVWPSASRAWELLNGVRLRTEANLTPQSTSYNPPDRNKRPAEDAFGEDRSGSYGTGFDMPGNDNLTRQSGNGGDGSGVQDVSTRLMAHMLGLEMPGIEPSTSYFPGYEWWPRMNQGVGPPSGNAGFPLNTDYNTGDMQQIPENGPTGQNWMPSNMATPLDYGLTYQYDFGQYGV